MHTLLSLQSTQPPTSSIPSNLLQSVSNETSDAPLNSGDFALAGVSIDAPHRLRSPRTTWKRDEDTCLLQLLLDGRHLLNSPKYISSPRRKFWEFISSQLRKRFQIARNTRQCRDRFNLLYSKAAKKFQNAHDAPRHKFDRLLKDITVCFYFNPEGNILLNPQSQITTVNSLPEHESDYTYDSEESEHAALDRSAGDQIEALLTCTASLSSEIRLLRQDITQLTKSLSLLHNGKVPAYRDEDTKDKATDIINYIPAQATASSEVFYPDNTEPTTIGSPPNSISWSF